VRQTVEITQATAQLSQARYALYDEQGRLATL
jgi:hypothetical protein